MKGIIMMLIFLFTWVGGYLLLSCLGLMFFDEYGNHLIYSHIIGDIGWFGIYFLFIGWGIACFPTCEYYQRNKDYFKSL